MNKNLFLLVALCAVSSQSFSMEESKDSDSSNVPSKVLTPRAAAPDEQSKQEDLVTFPTPAASSLGSKWTTIEKHPLRISTYVPGMQATLGDTFTPCVDAACAVVVTAGLGYGLYSQRSTIARGGKSLASGVVKASSATGSALKSGAQATGAGLVTVAKATPKVAGAIGGAALYPLKEALAHKTATAVGVTMPVIAAVVLAGAQKA